MVHGLKNLQYNELRKTWDLKDRRVRADVGLTEGLKIVR